MTTYNATSNDNAAKIDDLLFSVKISHVGPMTIR